MSDEKQNFLFKPAGKRVVKVEGGDKTQFHLKKLQKRKVLQRNSIM